MKVLLKYSMLNQNKTFLSIFFVRIYHVSVQKKKQTACMHAQYKTCMQDWLREEQSQKGQSRRSSGSE